MSAYQVIDTTPCLQVQIEYYRSVTFDQNVRKCTVEFAQGRLTVLTT